MKTYTSMIYENLLKSQGQNRNLISVSVFLITV